MKKILLTSATSRAAGAESADASSHTQPAKLSSDVPAPPKLTLDAPAPPSTESSMQLALVPYTKPAASSGSNVFQRILTQQDSMSSVDGKASSFQAVTAGSKEGQAAQAHYPASRHVAYACTSYLKLLSMFACSPGKESFSRRLTQHTRC